MQVASLYLNQLPIDMEKSLYATGFVFYICAEWWEVADKVFEILVITKYEPNAFVIKYIQARDC